MRKVSLEELRNETAIRSEYQHMLVHAGGKNLRRNYATPSNGVPIAGNV